MSKAQFAILPLALLISGAVTAATENPYYAGVRAGGVHYSDFDSKTAVEGGFTYGNPSSEFNIDRDDFAAGLFMGYNVTPWFAIETGYTWLGEVTLKNDDHHDQGKIEQKAIDLVGKFTYQASNNVDLYTKAGAAYQFSRIKTAAGVSDRDDSLIATAGLGAEYHFSDNLSARAEYQYYHDLETKPTGSATKYMWDANYVGLSLVYGFGAPAPVVVPVVEEVVEVVEPTIVTVDPITVSIPFAFDSYSITHADKERLDPIAKRLEANPQAELVVVGHTDSKGKEAYNQKLSVERAQKVANFLVAEYNLDANRVRAEGRGELDPVASNKTESGRTDNRRVEVTASGYQFEQEAVQK